MKHKIRNLIISLISFSGLSFLYRAYFKRQGPLVRVICFHDVADKVWFEEVIRMISNNYHFITTKEFHQQKFSFKKINILLTFDDGYQSWIDNCLPILEKYNAKGLFFINSGLLDIARDTERVATYMNDRLLITPKTPLTWEGAKQLFSAGHTIGGHTVSHPNLVSLSETEAGKEILEDKKRLESELNIVLKDFAYPFGTKRHINHQLLNLTESMYSFQYSAITGFFTTKNIYPVPRTLIEKNQSIKSIEKWLSGAYDMFYSLNKISFK